MDKKKVVNFIKTHKKEIAVATIAGVVGTTAGILGYKWYTSKNYGKLFKLFSEFGSNSDGIPIAQTVAEFLDDATLSIQPVVPYTSRTIRDSFSDEVISVFTEHGFDVDTTAISGMLVGLKKVETK
jgi:hypothetical protein